MVHSGHRRAMRRLLAAVSAVFIVAGSIPGVAAHGGHGHGFGKGPGTLTTQPAMLDVVAPGGWARPIITTGEMIDGYRFEAIPDGISFQESFWGSVDVYVNHETSRVPFPLAATGAGYLPTTNGNGSQNDFLNSQVSLLTLSKKTGGVLDAEYAIDSSEGFQRFCSNFIGTWEHGFRRPILFTNEEGVDWVKEADPTFPASPGDADGRQIGVVVAHDVWSGATRPIWGMGRLNHENSMPVPGYHRPVLLTGDDTFTTTAAISQSQLYMYEADSSKDLWNDKGDLWAFVSDTAGYNRYEDFDLGETTQINGHFIKVPKLIATGKNPDGSELTAAGVIANGWPVPLFEADGVTPLALPDPAPGTNWQTFNGVGIDGPQWVTEWWSRKFGAFGFIRVEDTAYDKRWGKSNVVYIVDSGRGTNAAVANGTSSNGRVWEMVLDKHNPTGNAKLRVLIEGDDRAVRDPERIHQPDNIESTKHGLYFTEDPGSQQQFPFGATDPANPLFDARATNARIWQYKFGAANPLSVVAVVNQSLDESAGYDVDPVPAGNHGFWEASGIIDVSDVFGRGTFLVSVQAHSLWVEGANAPDNNTRAGGAWTFGVPDGSPDWINKREGGQLLLIKIPGA
jgi:hypothetical protein